MYAYINWRESPWLLFLVSSAFIPILSSTWCNIPLIISNGGASFPDVHDGCLCVFDPCPSSDLKILKHFFYWNLHPSKIYFEGVNLSPSPLSISHLRTSYFLLGHLQSPFLRFGFLHPLYFVFHLLFLARHDRIHHRKQNLFTIKCHWLVWECFYFMIISYFMIDYPFEYFGNRTVTVASILDAISFAIPVQCYCFPVVDRLLGFCWLVFYSNIFCYFTDKLSWDCKYIKLMTHVKKYNKPLITDIAIIT